MNPDSPHPHDIDGLSADLARRLGADEAGSGPVVVAPASTPLPPALPPADQPKQRSWAPIALAGLLCLLVGLGAGWALFGRGDDSGPVTAIDDSIETEQELDQADTSGSRPSNDPTRSDEQLTLEDLFEQLPLDQLAPGESPLDGTPFGELPLDDFMSPEDLEQMQELLENMPSADELNELFGDLDGENLNELLDPERLDEMNELFEQLFGS